MTTKIKGKTHNLGIADKALMLSVEFHRLGNTRRLRNSQFQVDADPKMVRASKRLLDSDELKKISRFDGEVRDYIARRALPSMFKGGFWMLPIPMLDEVDAQLEKFAEDRAPLVEDFVKAYPALMDEAATLLRGTFNTSDYLTEDEVRRQFGLSWRYVSFGVPEQLEAIKKEVYDREQAKASAHWETATEEMQNLLRAAMADLVDHMVERLETGKDGKQKIFKASMIGNIMEFINTFDARNITEDAQLKELVKKARDLTEGVDAETLRTDEQLRAKLKIGMSGLKAKLDEIVVVKASRKIRYEEDEAPSGAAAAAAK